MGRIGKGYRAKSRHLLKKAPRERGLQPLSSLLKEYKPGERVVIVINSSTHKGMPHRRFHGKVGIIQGKIGRAYCIAIQEGGKKKTVISRPEHLRAYS
jgi:large subunit ribosomal protein L21e